MPRSPRIPPRRLPESVRRRLEVASALAWEALVETHVAQATRFVNLLGDLPLEESLTRYLLEMDLGESMISSVRTRVLVAIEEAPEATGGAERAGPAEADEDEDGWRRFRPDVVLRGVRERRRRDDQTELRIRLALARAEEAIIHTHVDNAITFAALLEEQVPLDRAVQHYLSAVALAGGRAQTVFQRTMARLADAHLPPAVARRAGSTG
jgi:exonuclease VII small subunit